jgi:hypothetical protein
MEELEALVGKTIVGVKKGLVYFGDDGQRVGHLYEIKTQDGETLHFACEGGDTSFYAGISQVDIKGNEVYLHGQDQQWNDGTVKLPPTDDFEEEQRKLLERE